MDAGQVTCAQCGEPTSSTAKFCAECGAPLTPRAPVAEVRKTVTALFCDVTGSTALGSRLDPEALRHLMEDWFARAGAVLARHGGTVEKFVGDAVMAVFGVPVANEDDAVRACRAAVELIAAAQELDRDVVHDHATTFAVRIGVETGEVLVGDPARGSTFASGTAVNTAARLEQAARPGECLIGPACHRLVEGVVVAAPRPGIELKGLDGPLDGWLLSEVLDQAEVTRALVGRLVGRERELALLRQAFDRAVGDRTCQLATLLGVAGMGKSRLAAELLRAVAGDALVLRGRCLSYGESVTWWALVEMVRGATGLTGGESEKEARDRLRALMPGAADAGEVVERIAAVAGLGGSPGSPEDTAWAVRRLLQELARRQPVVVVVDDLHWAESGMLAVVDDVVEWLRDAPVLVLVLARPELLDDHPAWGAGRVNAVTALLEPLGPDDVARLTQDLLGDALPDSTAAKVQDLAGGNPLYLEHIAGMLRDGSSGDDVAVPPTIAALLGARLDRLPAAERAVLGVASVMGQVFYRGAVAELVAHDQVSTHLSALMRKGLVRPTESDVPGQEALAFTHLLVRESAYSALPKGSRAVLHERFARWVDKTAEGQVYDDMVGAHLEAAFLARADLGRLDDRDRRLGVEASERLRAAARELVGADDSTAGALLERAVRLRDDESPAAWGLRMELVRLHLLHTRDIPRVIQLAEDVRVAAESAGDVVWARVALLSREVARYFIGADENTEALESLALENLALLTPHAHYLGLGMAEGALSLVAVMRLDSRAMREHDDRSADWTERGGWPRLAEVLRFTTKWGNLSGSLPASEGLARVRGELARASSRAGRAQCLLGVAFFAGLLGRAEESEQAWSDAEQLVDSIGSTYQHQLRYGRARFAAFTGEWQGAVALFEATAAHFEASGELAFLSTEVGYLAHALLWQGEPERARVAVARALELGAPDDALTNGTAFGAAAWLAGLDGDRGALETAVARALEALPSDQRADRVLAHLAAAEGFAALGDHDAAAGQRRLALAAAEEHENLAVVRKIQQLLRDA